MLIIIVLFNLSQTSHFSIEMHCDHIGNIEIIETHICTYKGYSLIISPSYTSVLQADVLGRCLHAGSQAH